MSKGIKRIIISEEEISSGQLIKFPQLLNGCEVYGLRANGKSVTLSVEIEEKERLGIEEKVKNKQIHSGIKWVYGKVNSLQKGGISWHGWYRDANRNNKKDGNEQWILNPSIEQISKIDIYNVQGNYNIQNTIQIKFDDESYGTPTLSWVEPFLIHPELHFSKAPKGIFIVPLAEQKIYRSEINIDNSPFNRTLQIPLPKTEEEAKEHEHVVYYGENLSFFLHTCTLLIPEHAWFSVKIYQRDEFSYDGDDGVQTSETHKTIYDITSVGLSLEEDDFWDPYLDYELTAYLSHYFKRAIVKVPLAIDNKPKDQKEQENRTFLVTINHIYQAFIAAGTDIDKIYPSKHGYLTIGYTDMYSLLEIQNEEVDKFVEKASEVLLQPQGDPCHYTWIQAHQGEKKITLFEEKKEGIKPKLSPVDVIAGDQEPYRLTLSTNLKTAECKTQQHTQGADSVFYFPDNLSSEKQGIDIEKISYDSVELRVPYHYIRDHSTLGVINDFPFNYFWLNEKDVQKHVIMVETCRYKIPVKINVYPDIEWYIKFEYLCKNPIKYRDTWVKMRQARIEDAVNKAQAADIDGYDGDLQTKFKIGAGVTYNNVQKGLSYEFEGKIKSILKTFLKIKNTINSLIGGNQAKNGFGFLPESAENACKSIAEKIKRQPVMLEISSPGVSLELGWKNINNAAPQSLVAQQIDTCFKFSPLIGGKGTLDLIAIAEYIPYIERIVRAVDQTLVALNINATFALSAVGKVDIDASISGLYHIKTGFTFNKNNYNLAIKGRFGLEVELSAKGKWKIKTWILWGDEHTMKAGVSAKACSYFEPTLGFGADKKGPYLEGAVKFSGIKIVLEINAQLGKGRYSKSKEIVIVEAPKEPILGGKKYFNENDK